MLKQILLLILFIFFKILKIIISILFFPFVYPFRNIIRTKEVWVVGYMYKPRKWLFPLWCILNDSEYFSYHPYWFPTKEGYYPKFIFAFWQKTENMKQGYLHFNNIFEALNFGYGIKFTLWFKIKLYIANFLMDYWFNGIRNSMVNFNNYMMMITGECCGYEWYIGCDSWEKLKQDKKGFRLEKRIFWSSYRQKFCKRLYLEFYLFKRWYQFGWLKKGRFEIDLWKNK